MIPTYNCADYLAETLCSGLRPDPGPDIMQIEVVDDHSERDDPECVTRDVGGGRVSFFRLLPPTGADEITSFATVDTALTALRRSHRMLRAGETHGPLVQLREALRLSRSPRVLAGSAKLLAHWALVHLRRRLGRVRSGSPSPTSHS